MQGTLENVFPCINKQDQDFLWKVWVLEEYEIATESVMLLLAAWQSYMLARHDATTENNTYSEIYLCHCFFSNYNW